MKNIKVSLIQTKASENVDDNIQKQEELVIKAAEGGAQIICLQELCTTTYFCNEMDSDLFKLALEVPNTLLKRFQTTAKKHQVVILLPFFEKGAAGVYYNSMAVIDADGSHIGTYRKMHIPDDPGFHEKYYFTPGDGGFQVYDTAYGKIGTLICWDQWFPEAARITAMMGADILIYPTAIGVLANEDENDRASFHDAWKTMQRSHAIANGCFVASINRVGTENGITFWGGSFVAGPFGEILAEAGTKEEILSADVDFSTIEKQRQTWPFFRDRRIDSYKPILRRYLK